MEWETSILDPFNLSHSSTELQVLQQEKLIKVVEG